MKYTRPYEILRLKHFLFMWAGILWIRLQTLIHKVKDVIPNQIWMEILLFTDQSISFNPWF